MSAYIDEVLKQSIWAIDSSLKYQLEEQEDLRKRSRRTEDEIALLVLHRQELVAELKGRGGEVPISTDSQERPLLNPPSVDEVAS